MQFKTIVAAALLPLLAVAEDTTLTSTMTMTKYVTISKVATSSVYANSTATFHPTGTGYSTILPTTTDVDSSGSPTTSSPTVSPTIDNNNGAGSLTALSFAGVAGMVLAAMM
ncbi:hypothetical protein SAMD00023353_2000070 [Rosellinia necatrix]|uniref:Uncharacterized protein n=1 Tax=Rosellinia necatrix TaxID=77044 RepID=A0A1W2TF84_ROSNE|nr:hypothetical protein SAMD00023353_2000070 [Rosellinia necatrix]